MKWLFSSNTLLFVLGFAAGLMLLEPAACSAEVVTGKILEVHPEKGQLILQPGLDINKGDTSLTVSYPHPVSAAGKMHPFRLPACIHPGKVVQIQGSYTDQEHSLFIATSIRRMHHARYLDATGVRARLESCRHEQ